MPTPASALLVPDDIIANGASTTDITTTPTSSVRIEVRVDSQQWDDAAWYEVVNLFVPGATGLPKVALALDGPFPLFRWVDGTETQVWSTVPLPFDRGIHWLAVDFDLDDGGGNHVVEFQTSDDDTDDPDVAVWVTLDTITDPGVASIDSAVAPVSSVGRAVEYTGAFSPLPGYYRVARVTIDAVVEGFPEFFAEAVGTTTFTDTVGATWGMVGDSGIVDHPSTVPTITLPGASLTPQVNAPRITVPEDVEHPLRARLLALPDLSLVASIFDSFADQARAQRSATGTGSLSLMRDDPVVDLVEPPNRAVQFVIEGQAAFTMIVEGRTDQVVDVGEESREVATFTGRGHLMVLERMRLYPSRGVGQQPVQRSRVFNFAEPVYDDSTWPLSVDAGAANGPVRQPGLPQVGIPDGGPDVAGNFWKAAVGDTQVIAPPGDRYYRGTVSIPITRPYVVFWAADNWGDLYIDGQKASSLPQAGSYRNFISVTPIEVVLSAGNIVLAARVSNNENGGVPNPVGLYLVIANTTANGEINEIIATSADIAWKAVGPLDEPPGMTPGKVANIALDEYEARCFNEGQEPAAYITRTWTDTHDSLGQTWTSVPTIATDVGTNLLTFFTEMSATYFDMRMRPGSFTLDLVRKGTVVDSGVTYDTAPPTNNRAGNVRGLSRRQAG